MSGEASDFARFEDLKDEGAVPVFGFRVLQSIKPTGEPEVAWAWEGERIPAFWMVGTLMSAAFECFHNQMHGEDDDA